MSDLLDIPPFLLNQKNVRKTRGFSDKQIKWFMPAKVELPKGNWTLYWVHVGNHSVLGSGRRLVYARLGRKWVYIIERPSGNRTKMRLSAWNIFKPEEAEEAYD